MTRIGGYYVKYNNTTAVGRLTDEGEDWTEFLTRSRYIELGNEISNCRGIITSSHTGWGKNTCESIGFDTICLRNNPSHLLATVGWKKKSRKKCYHKERNGIIKKKLDGRIDWFRWKCVQTVQLLPPPPIEKIQPTGRTGIRPVWTPPRVYHFNHLSWWNLF